MYTLARVSGSYDFKGQVVDDIQRINIDGRKCILFVVSNMRIQLLSTYVLVTKNSLIY